MNVSITFKELFMQGQEEKNSKKTLTFGKLEWKSKFDIEIKVENT